MNLLKSSILTIINIIRFSVIRNKKTRKSLRKAKLGLTIKVEKNGELTMDTPCLITRNHTYIYVREGAHLHIGSSTFFNTNCQVACRESIHIGNSCLFGPNTCIFDHDHYFDKNGISRTEYKTKPVYIGNNVWLGAGVIVLKGSYIGNNVIVGAGTVVSGTIPDNTILTQKRENIIRDLH